MTPRTSSGAARFALTFAVALAACSDSSTAPAPVESDDLPLLLSELDRSGSIVYRPEFVNWSNGLEKERRIVLPAGARVDISDADLWDFPEGTVMTKRFSIREPSGNLRHVETRVFRRLTNDWETATYLWREDQTDAELTDGRPIAVTVTNESGRTFDHTVPGRSGCQACHASSPSFILGFREVQLNHSGQLEALASRGVFNQPLPANPARIQDENPETRWMKGYVEANCVHCHNGVTQFDMSHPVFLANTIGVTGSSTTPRITPGDPQASDLFRRFESRVMPPIGVQIRHDEAVERMRAWIRSLN